ncbi:MAG: hypothetical protein WA021_04505, partial [Minisyncoccia bacterium]
MEYSGAYLVRGEEAALDLLIMQLVKEKVIERSSPDLFAKEYRSFGVEDAAEVRARVRTKPVAGDQRVFIIAAPSMTTEAQNALLKTLEEPSANAAIFLVVPSPEMLLPTVRSRMQPLMLEGTNAAESLVDADDFLAALPAKRIEMLKPLYDHEDEGRDIGSVIAFLQSLVA